MGGELDTIRLIAQAGLVVKLVLLLLAVFSVVSWALIVSKWRELRRAEQDSEAFLEVYREGSFDAAYRAARECESSPLAAVFLKGYAEFNRVAKYGAGRGVDDGQVDALARQIHWTASREGVRLERGLPFLATTGSATPFIGLFGTVVGIITAFESIGRAGSANLAVVAPGIAEALIATAVGLLAAIPATIFYNQFVGKLRGIASAIDVFTAEYETDLRRQSRAAPAREAPGN